MDAFEFGELLQAAIRPKTHCAACKAMRDPQDLQPVEDPTTGNVELVCPTQACVARYYKEILASESERLEQL